MKMPKTIYVLVLAKHIDNGIFIDVSGCPIALALKDAGYTNIRVGTNHCRIYPTVKSRSPVLYTMDYKQAEMVFEMTHHTREYTPVSITLTLVNY